MIKYGDFLTLEINGCTKTFRYIEPYQGGRGDPDCVVEAVDKVDPFNCWPAQRMHDDYYLVYADDAKVIPQDDPRTFVGLGL